MNIVRAIYCNSQRMQTKLQGARHSKMCSSATATKERRFLNFDPMFLVVVRLIPNDNRKAHW